MLLIKIQIFVYDIYNNTLKIQIPMKLVSMKKIVY